MNLPAPLQEALQKVAAGKPFPWVWLATSDAQRGAQLRTVRLLSYNLLQGHWIFACHRDHAKVEQVHRDPRGQLCFLREEGPLQVRVDVLLWPSPGESHPQGSRLWQKVPGPQRRALYQAHPHTPQPPEAFWLMEARLEQGPRAVEDWHPRVEVLILGEEPRRTLWERLGGQWKGRTIDP